MHTTVCVKKAPARRKKRFSSWCVSGQRPAHLPLAMVWRLAVGWPQSRCSTAAATRRMPLRGAMTDAQVCSSGGAPTAEYRRGARRIPGSVTRSDPREITRCGQAAPAEKLSVARSACTLGAQESVCLRVAGGIHRAQTGNKSQRCDSPIPTACATTGVAPSATHGARRAASRSSRLRAWLYIPSPSIRMYWQGCHKQEHS